MSEELEFGTGWKLDPILRSASPAARVRSFLRKGEAMERDKPDSYTIGSPVILNQGSSSACTAFGVWLAAYLWAVKHGLEMPVPSPWFAYQAAAFLEAGGNEQGMRDDGVSTSSIERAYEKFGIVSLAEWGKDQGAGPLSPILRPPQLLRMRAQRTNADLVRIYDRGASLVERVVDSLSLDEPCPLALGIGDNWRGSGPSLLEPPSKVTGYHLVYAFGYRGYPIKPEIQIANSWGKGWREDGKAWLSAATVAGAKAAWFVRGVKTRAK